MHNDFVIASANDEAAVSRAVTSNAARGLPSPSWNTQSGPISVCGNGPSLRSTFPVGYPIAALNGAWKTLLKNGVMPDYIIAFDPSPKNVAWFEDAPTQPTYILASCMDPAVFDMLAGKKVQIWHVVGDAEAKVSKTLIGGGFTIGCRALNLLNLIGYQYFNLYGYDSCYALDGEHHATPQALEHGAAPQVYTVGDRSFLAEPWMAAQVQEFLKQIETHRYHYTVDAKCDGLLPAALAHNTLEILYDLDVCPGSFDFFCSMANAENYRKVQGYSRAVCNFKAGSADGFRPNEVINYPHGYKQLMLNNVVRPLLKMFAIQEVDAISDKAMQFQYAGKESLEYFENSGDMADYRESDEARAWAEKLFSDNPYVITLREAEHWPQRNSNLAEWVKFAKTLDRRVIFVRDTARAFEPIHGCKICPEASMDVHKRLALYRMAKMNFTVATGPSIMLSYSRDIPYIQFFTKAPGYPFYAHDWLKDSMGFSHQYPWRDPNIQLNVFENDTFENIMIAHQSLLNGLQQAAE